jgi:hypothetical protein
VIKKLQDFLIIDFHTFFLSVSLNRNFLTAKNENGPKAAQAPRSACPAWPRPAQQVVEILGEFSGNYFL